MTELFVFVRELRRGLRFRLRSSGGRISVGKIARLVHAHTRTRTRTQGRKKRTTRVMADETIKPNAAMVERMSTGERIELVCGVR
jgi:hypothetical protein